jgi:hypothetical protein
MRTYTVTLNWTEGLGTNSQGEEVVRQRTTTLAGVSEIRLRAIRARMRGDEECEFWGIDAKAE